MHDPDSTMARPDAALTALRAALDGVCSRDHARLLGRWRALARTPDPARLAALAADVAASAARRAARVAAKPVIRLDEGLPITARAQEIIDLIRGHQVLVIAGETGSGKTTQLPKLCLAAGRGEAGLIGCTQPRRLAARAVARRVAAELGSEIGGLVGFQVRFSEQVGERALVKFMTDGILLAETQSDRGLSAYDTIILDEAHERSLNVDFLLGYLKQLLARRRDLKLIITSATLDTARFAAHFGDAPVLTVEGRAHPVELRWRPPPERGEANLAEQIVAALDEVSRDDPRGDVLVFLPGEREIRDAHLALARRKYRETEILPLYARLSAAEQDRVFRPGPQRRVVLATNVAETSLTVPRIRYVVDTGSARVKRYSPRSQIERLHVEPIAQSAADQRKGRCGRIGPGICYRLYGEDDYARRPLYTDPEIARSSLAGVILRMLALGLGTVEAFPFLDPPEPRAIADGYRRLDELGAIDAERRLTANGRLMARLPIDVQLARMLVEASARGTLRELTTIVAFLSTQDPRERPADARPQADAAHAAFADPKSDFVGVLKLWDAYSAAHEELTQSKLRDWCARHFLSFLRMREWRELHRQLLLVTEELGLERPGPEKPGLGTRDSGLEKSGPESRVSGSASGLGSRSSGSRVPGPESRPSSESRLYESIHRCILAGLPTQVGRKDERGGYRGTRERKFQVFPGSALAKAPPQWLLAAQILDLGGKVWGLMCARVEPAWIEQQAAHLVRRSWRDARWSRPRGAVIADEQVTLFGLTLVEQRTVTFQRQDPAQAHAIFVREALLPGAIDCRADFVDANRRVLEQAQEIEARQRRQGLLKSDVALEGFFAGKLPADIAGTAALDAWYRKAAPAAQAALRWSLADVLEGPDALDAGAYPAALELAGQRLRLDYRFVPGDAADGVTLNLPLALLNAVPAARCEWLVPGLLAEKAAELIRGLPKALRRNFVPAPDFARAFAEAEAARDEPLAVVLAAFLARTTGVAVSAADFAAGELPAHLRMRFRVHDEHAATLAEGRDLQAIRSEWAASARAAFARRTDAELVREDVAGFDFDDIPGAVQATGGLTAYPALVDLGDAVALRVFEHAADADAEHRRGVERLLRRALAVEFKRARRQLPIAPALALKYAALGSLDGLREDLVEGGFADLRAAQDFDVRTRAAFAALQAIFAGELFAAALARLKLAEPIIVAQAELTPWLEPPLLGFARASYDDLREQRDHLLASGFLRELAPSRLAHYPRYLKAMRLRGERLRLDPARDQSRMLQVLPCWRAWLRARSGDADPAVLDALRWLIEELRVSLFAQELGTAEPVSPKRMQRALQALEASAVGSASR